MKYTCESGVGVFHERQRASSFELPPTVLTKKPAVQYLAEQREHALCNSHSSGIMGAAHGSVQERS